MNISEKKDFFSEPNYRSTLHDISVDNSDKDNIKNMTESQRLAIDFDKVKEAYRQECGTPNAPICSVDALLLEEKLTVMVEFKNGILIKNGEAIEEEKEKIISKMRDSLLIYCDLKKQSISETRTQLKFILVYNEEKNVPGIKQISGKIKKIELTSALNNIKRFEKIYFKSVVMYSADDFDKFLKKHKIYE